MGRRALFGLLWLFTAGFSSYSCGETFDPFAPPFLLSTGGLTGLVEIDQHPVSFGSYRDWVFPKELLFGGHIFAAGGKTAVRISVRPQGSDTRTAAALYGPRAPNGLFGGALSFVGASPGEDAKLWDIALGHDGDYLILVRDLSGGDGGYRLVLDCTSGCEDVPPCAPLVCGTYCPTGLKRDESACPICECASGCTKDDDCPRNFECKDGSCRKIPFCECKDPYDPVCSVDGRTFANECELNCAGAELGSHAACDDPGCRSSGDCGSAEVCVDGKCRYSCNCDGQAYDPVCGTDGLTYSNECERKCTGVPLSHYGSCDRCDPEICDGNDNDCDGTIDEGCAGSCTIDSDCGRADLICWAGECVGGIACPANPCPVGQGCVDGYCRGKENCVPESCDGLDNDCDGDTDEGCTCSCKDDMDCDDNNTDTIDSCDSCGCTNTPIPCSDGTGCDDQDPTTVDWCDNGKCVHERCGDGDGDGYGPGAFCLGPDCDDKDSSIHPGAIEVCGDGLDNNCDDNTDEPGCTCASDPDCGVAEALVCRNGICTGSCRISTDCDPGFECPDGGCLWPCRGKEDCPSGQECLKEFCGRL